MVDLQHNQPALSVSEISQALKRTVEDAFGYVRVRGELSGTKQAPSGHVYFNVKDDQAVLGGVCWKGVVKNLPFTPEDGLEVIITGKLSIYAGRSNYQIVAQWIEPAGEGALMALLEKRKQSLQKEGLFAPETKQKLPFLPQRIAVITSPTGAVIRDILHRLDDRFGVPVQLFPVTVQGEKAASEIVTALEQCERITPAPDLVIIARGGGSVEDLWPFNEETVIRAVHAFSIPVISAIGHETDTTLLDYVADWRAPTPTAAAERAVPVKAQLWEQLIHQHTGLSQAMTQRLYYLHEKIAHSRLKSPLEIAASQAQKTDQLIQRLSQAHHHYWQYLHNHLQALKPASPLQYLQQALKHVQQYDARIQADTRMLHRRIAEQLQHLSQSLAVQIQQGVQQQYLRFTPLANHLQHCAKSLLVSPHQQIQQMSALLAALSYKNILKRGFAVVRDASGTVLPTAMAARKNQPTSIEFSDDHLTLQQATASRRKQAKKKPQTDNQGSLF